MSISLQDLEFLASAPGGALLAHLREQDLSNARTLGILSTLRKTYTIDQSRAALTMARLQLKAMDKFGADARRMFFTEDALQQASDPLVRRYRADTFPAVARLLDACCGIGADALTFAQAGAQVLGLDLDPLRVAIARHNASALGYEIARFEVADVRQGIPSGYDLIFFDPARRDAQGRRIYDVERYLPPLSTVRVWPTGPALVKLSPGVDVSQLTEYDGGVEFISVAGDLKECVLRLNCGVDGISATLLHEGAVLHWRRDGPAPEVGLSAPLGWLVEPDPAIIRAGLVQDAAAHFNAVMLDSTIAYLTADDPPRSPWVRCWPVLDWMPFHVKALRAYLRQHDVGRVIVKKRGSPVTPEALIPQLKLKGAQERVLVLTRCRQQPVILICGVYDQPRSEESP